MSKHWPGSRRICYTWSVTPVWAPISILMYLHDSLTHWGQISDICYEVSLNWDCWPWEVCTVLLMLAVTAVLERSALCCWCWRWLLCWRGLHCAVDVGGDCWPWEVCTVLLMLAVTAVLERSALCCWCWQWLLCWRGLHCAVDVGGVERVGNCI